MYQHLEQKWKTEYEPKVIADKVKFFFKMYGYNRNKATVLTPSYHAENYSPEDNRFDHRQFLYPNWKRQFENIDKLVEIDTVLREQNKKKEQLLSRSNNYNPEEYEDDEEVLSTKSPEFLEKKPI